MPFRLIPLLFSLLLTPVAVLAGIGQGFHVNIAIYQPEEGAATTPDYPATAKSEQGNLNKILAGQAEPFISVHSPHIHSGDVINLQADVLGKSDNGALEDDGLNCQLSYQVVSNSEFRIGGICTLLIATATGADKRNIIIAPTKIVTTAGRQSDWVLLSSDAKSGIGIYANIEP